MLSTRVIACLDVHNGRTVKGINFINLKDAGDPVEQAKQYSVIGADEICFLDISATNEKRRAMFNVISKTAESCFVPLTVGGGVNNLSDFRDLLNSGADKVCINSAARNDIALVEEASNIFGAQCITVSVDVIFRDGEYKIYTYENNDILDISLISYIKGLEQKGAGEIFLNSVNRDGSKEGYDIKLIKSVTDNVNIPVIACGGVGKNSHFSEAIIYANCSAVSASNIFQHTEHSTISAKAMLLKDGVEVRLNGDVKYSNFEFDQMGRPF